MNYKDGHPERREGVGVFVATSRDRRARSFALRIALFFSPPRPSAFISGLSIGGLFVLGCSGYTGPRSVVNDDPAVKIPQIRRAVDANDKSVEPQLVKDLDSDDAAVRFYSIGALTRLNEGERLGYDWTVADRFKRAASIEKWKNFIAQRNGASTKASDE